MRVGTPRRYPYSQAARYIPNIPGTNPAENTFNSCKWRLPNHQKIPLRIAKTIMTAIP
jgi:hypothetical protein